MKKINFIVFIIISLALILFDLYKAVHTSFTHDESWTYLHYVDENIIDILSYHDSYANNHILNTLLMKLFKIFLGDSELALRLPNIASHLLYMVFTFKLFERYSNKFLIPFFILANANPFLLDFFSLARGYGLAIGLMNAGLYYYCRYLENRKLKNHVFALVFIGLASFANFALLNVFLVMILVHNIFQFLIDGQSFSFKNLLRANKVNAMIAIFFSLILYLPIQTIIKDKLIIVGGADGFWSDTVNSLLYSSAYYTLYEKIIVGFWQIVIISFSVLFVFKCVQYSTRKNVINLTQKIVLFFGLITFFIVFGTTVQHWLLGTSFLMSRFALFIYPLFIFTTCFLIADTWNSGFNYLKAVFLFLLTGIFFTHTCYSLNTSWYYDWQYDMDTKQMLAQLEKARSKINSQISLGVTWIFEPAVDFYKKTWHLDWLIRVDRNGAKPINDYYFITQQEFNKIQQDEIENIQNYPITNNYLLKNTKKAIVKKGLHLKAFNNKYVCADGNLHDNLVLADRDAALWMETFSLIIFNDSTCSLQAYNDCYLSAEIGSQTQITFNRQSISFWETFTMIGLDSNHVAFKAANGKYLSVDAKSLQLFANRDSIGRQEKFKFVLQDNKHK